MPAILEANWKRDAGAIKTILALQHQDTKHLLSLVERNEELEEAQHDQIREAMTKQWAAVDEMKARAEARIEAQEKRIRELEKIVAVARGLNTAFWGIVALLALWFGWSKASKP